MMEEQLDILRRIAERGLKLAQSEIVPYEDYIDIFQHMLDEIERTRKQWQNFSKI
jgi:hypothetical protein